MKRILIVEDDPFIALDLQCVLEDAGYEVIGPVADVKAGLAAIEDSAPSAGLLDYNLGTEKSTPLADALSAKDIPFAVLSGQAVAAIRADIGSKTDIITKPVAPEVIVERVGELVA